MVTEILRYRQTDGRSDRQTDFVLYIMNVLSKCAYVITISFNCNVAAMSTMTIIFKCLEDDLVYDRLLHYICLKSKINIQNLSIDF